MFNSKPLLIRRLLSSNFVVTFLAYTGDGKANLDFEGLSSDVSGVHIRSPENPTVEPKAGADRTNREVEWQICATLVLCYKEGRGIGSGNMVRQRLAYGEANPEHLAVGCARSRHLVRTAGICKNPLKKLP